MVATPIIKLAIITATIPNRSFASLYPIPSGAKNWNVNIIGKEPPKITVHRIINSELNAKNSNGLR